MGPAVLDEPGRSQAGGASLLPRVKYPGKVSDCCWLLLVVAACSWLAVCRFRLLAAVCCPGSGGGLLTSGSGGGGSGGSGIEGESSKPINCYVRV